MARKSDKQTRGKPKAAAPAKELTRKEYEKELRRLQTELCLIQDWVKAAGQRIIARSHRS